MEKSTVIDHLKAVNVQASEQLIETALQTADDKKECLNKYPEGVRNMIILNFVTLIALGSSRGIKSQSSQSGASRTFEDNSYSSILDALRALDKENCLAQFLPEPKEKRLYGGIYVSGYGCGRRRY